MIQKIPHWLLLGSVLVIGLFTRLYKIDTPLADWHSWRQADTASVTREYVKHNYSLLEPHYHDLSSIPNGLDNPEGYRMVEFPLINWGTAQLLRASPQLELVKTSRLVSVSFSLISIISLYGLIWSLTRRRVLAFTSTAWYAVLPYIVYYSRVILPEPAMVGTQLLSVWLFVLWLQRLTQQKNETVSSRHKVWTMILFIGSVLSLAVSLLLKPTAVFIAPVYIVLSFSYLGFSAFISPWLWGYVIIAAAPVIGWRQWIQQYPTGIPASDWLLNGNGIRLRPAWWRWLFADRIARLISGYWGVSLLVAGLVSKIRAKISRKSLFDWVTYSWAFGMVAYLIIFATGNVQHDYYQAMLSPLIALLLGRGVVWFISLPNKVVRRWIVIPIMGVVVGLTIFFSWWEVRGYYNINNPAIVVAGQQVDKIVPQDAQVIAPYGGDTAFLFQTNRTGWPIHSNLQHMIDLGADYYVTTTKDEQAQEVISTYQVLEDTDQYTIVKLVPKKTE